MKFDHKRVKDLRVARGMSQDEVATKIGKPRQQYGKWEDGTHEPGLDVIGDIAKALDVPASFLIVED